MRSAKGRPPRCGNQMSRASTYRSPAPIKTASELRRAIVHSPPRPIAGVGYPEASESQIRRIAQWRSLVRFHNQYPNQLVSGVWENSASNRTPWGLPSPDMDNGYLSFLALLWNETGLVGVCFSFPQTTSLAGLGAIPPHRFPPTSLR